MKHSLFDKIFLGFLVLSLAVFAIVAIYSTYATRHALVEDKAEMLSNEATLIGEQVIAGYHQGLFTIEETQKNLEYYKAHPTVTFNSNYESDVYKIFAYFVTEVEPYQTSDGYVFDYHNYLDLSDKSVYNDFIGNITERSQIVTAVDVKYGDEFLTLSTCSNEFEPSRFVIFARKTRKGEDTSVDTSAAYLNPQAKEPDWKVIFK